MTGHLNFGSHAKIAPVHASFVPPHSSHRITQTVCRPLFRTAFLTTVQQPTRQPTATTNAALGIRLLATKHPRPEFLDGSLAHKANHRVP